MDKGTQNWHWVAYERAIESLRRDAHDGERDAVEQLLLADDVGIAVEAFFPEPVTDDGDGMAVASPVFFGLECAAEDWANSEGIKIVRGDYAAGDSFGPLADIDCGAR
jgi:hypothetical protein